LPVEILLEPRSEELRRLFRDSVRFAERVFKDRYIHGVRVVGAEPEQAEEVYSVVLKASNNAYAAEKAREAARTRYGGVHLPGPRIIVLSVHAIGNLPMVFHEFAHAATDELIDGFIEEAEEEFAPLYELIGIARRYVADVELAREADQAVGALLVEYPAVYGMLNYVKYRNRRLTIDVVWEVSYEMSYYIEKSAERVRKLMEAAYREIERRAKEGKWVHPVDEEVIKAYTKTENIEDAMYCTVRRWTLIPKADEILTKVMQRLPADLYEEFKHLTWE